MRLRRRPKLFGVSAEAEPRCLSANGGGKGGATTTNEPNGTVAGLLAQGEPAHLRAGQVRENTAD